MSNKSDQQFMLIGAGLGRTGTMSTWAALEKLGYSKCYHWHEMFKKENKFHIEIWNELVKTKMNNNNELIETSQWDTILKGYKSGVDEPLSLFYKELMKYYPNAKVILTVRDNGQKWYKSYLQLCKAIEARNRLWFLNLISKYFKLNGMLAYNVGKIKFGNDLENKIKNDSKYCIKIYNEWNEEVKRYVPKDKLLVFNVKQGWKPLADFLDIKEIPTEPFPHLNESAKFKKMATYANLAATVVNCGLTAIAVVSLYWLFRSL